MTKHPIALTIALAFATSAALSGCDRITSLTEQEYIERAKDFEDQGNVKASVVELKNAIQKNPDSPQARLLLGQVYLKLGMGAEAEKELSQAEKLGVSRESILPQLGEALLLTGEYKRVLDEIQPGNQTSKLNLARIYQLRADALLMRGNLEDACNLFQQSLETDANNPPTYWGLARCAVIKRDLPKAKEWLDLALKLKKNEAKTWVYIGDLERKNNNLQGALTAYDNALKSEPNNVEALGQRISAHLAAGQQELASKDLQQLKKLAPGTPATKYLQALIHFHQKKYPQAQGALQEVFKAAPNYAPAILLSAMTSHALGSYQQAESDIKRYLTYAPNEPYALRLLATIQMNQNQPDKALATLSPLLTDNKENTAALILAAEARFKQREFKKATALLERANEIDPDNISIRTKLGFSQIAAGNTQLAVTGLEAAVALDGDQHQATALLVLTYLNRKEYDKALAAIDVLEQKLPNNPITHNVRGSAFFGKNDPANARNSFEKALSINPTFFLAAENLAKLDLMEGKPDAARKRFLNILEKDKNNTQVMMALASLAAHQKQEAELIRWLQQASSVDSKDIRPRAALVKHYLSNKQNQTALDLATQSVKSNPDNLEALNLLGSTQMAVGDKAASVSTFERMVQLAPQSPDALLNLALAQVSASQLNGARTNLQRAIRIKPDLIRAQYGLMQLEIADKKYESALQIARKIQRLQPRSPIGYSSEADILMTQKQYAQAIKMYEQASARGAGSTGFINLHRAYSLAGNTAAADQQLKTLVRQYPTDSAARLYAAEVHTSSGRIRDAIAQYEELLKAKPNDIVALNNLAGLYLQVRDSRALPMAEKALKLAPNQPPIQDTVGWILVETGELSRGRDLLRSAAAHAPNALTIRYHYAVALARSGDKAAAKKELESIVKTRRKFPEHESAKSLLSSL